MYLKKGIQVINLIHATIWKDTQLDWVNGLVEAFESIGFVLVSMLRQLGFYYPSAFYLETRSLKFYLGDLVEL